MEKLLNIKYILVCILIVCLSSCDKKKVFSINNHSFIELKKTDSIYIFYKPCDASILKYRINNDKLIYRTHQNGDYDYKIDTIEYINDSTVNIRHRLDKNSPLLNLSIKKEKKYWLIDNKVFIDSLYSKNIPYIIQPCSDCFEDCDKKENNTTSDYSNKLNEKALNKWKGKYTTWIDAPEDMDVRLGVQYDIKISNDSVILSRESNFAPYTYLCFTKQTKDTLFFKYNKIISDSPQYETEKHKLPLLKMYNENGNIYVISPIVYDSSLNSNIPILFEKE